MAELTEMIVATQALFEVIDADLHDDYQQMQDCLKAGAQLDVTDDQGRLPLHLVAGRTTGDFAKHAQLLIDHGADVNAFDAQGRTPLSYAILSKNPKIVASLIEAGAEVNRHGNPVYAPLKQALTMERDSIYALRMMLPSEQQTPLTKGSNANSVYQPAFDVSMLLLKAGALMPHGAPMQLSAMRHAQAMQDAEAKLKDIAQTGVAVFTPADICALANRGHHHYAMQPRYWRELPQALNQLMDALPLWLRRDIVAHQPELAALIAPPSPLVQEREWQSAIADDTRRNRE